MTNPDKPEFSYPTDERSEKVEALDATLDRYSEVLAKIAEIEKWGDQGDYSPALAAEKKVLEERLRVFSNPDELPPRPEPDPAIEAMLQEAVKRGRLVHIKTDYADDEKKQALAKEEAGGWTSKFITPDNTKSAKKSSGLRPEEANVAANEAVLDEIAATVEAKDVEAIEQVVTSAAEKEKLQNEIAADYHLIGYLLSTFEGEVFRDGEEKIKKSEDLTPDDEKMLITIMRFRQAYEKLPEVLKEVFPNADITIPASLSVIPQDSLRNMAKTLGEKIGEFVQKRNDYRQRHHRTR